MNTFICILSRISHVAGREGHAPDFLSYIHIERLTPVAPILLNVRISKIRNYLNRLIFYNLLRRSI